jgi:Na+-driven multidrug efflux pump
MAAVIRDAAAATHGETPLVLAMRKAAYARRLGAALLRGLKDVKIPAFITLVAYWGIAISMGYIVGIRLGHGGVAIWGGLAAGLFFAAVFLALRFNALTRRCDEHPR